VRAAGIHGLQWLVLSGALLTACTSAEEECTAARAAALTAWSAYTGELAAERDKAKAKIDESHIALRMKVDPRIDAEAKKNADRLYAAGSDEWVRGIRSYQTGACMKDAECSALKHGIAEAQASIEDLEERLALAEKAEQATQGDSAAAHGASTAAIIDPPRPALKAAQGATARLVKSCESVPLKPAE
jgi:hypothetical protein